MLTLVLGGARSGKSQFAEEIVGDRACLYVATARPFSGEFDADFRARIATHVARRPAHWETEDGRDLIDVLHAFRRSPAAPSTVLVDDLGTWVTAHLDVLGGWDGPRGQLDELYEHLAAACKQVPDSVEVILVSPEVGMGVIPEHHAGRLFRDEIGTLNQMMAALSDRVYLVVAGQSLALK